jgi:hypothetical protein
MRTRQRQCHCPKAVLDEVDAPRDPERADGVALSAVMKKAAENPTVVVRCTARRRGRMRCATW